MGIVSARSILDRPENSIGPEIKKVLTFNDEYDILKKNIPKQFHWVIHLMKLRDQGYILKFVYNRNGKKEVTDNLKHFQLDSQMQSYVPVKPQTVRVQKYREGRGIRDIGELHGTKDFLDPPVDIAMKIFNAAKRL